MESQNPHFQRNIDIEPGVRYQRPRRHAAENPRLHRCLEDNDSRGVRTDEAKALGRAPPLYRKNWYNVDRQRRFGPKLALVLPFIQERVKMYNVRHTGGIQKFKYTPECIIYIVHIFIITQIHLLSHRALVVNCNHSTFFYIYR